jgi:AcrR family transcriptional regulator
MDTAVPGQSTDVAPRPGRPRSERARQAILGATADLLEHHGFHAITMDAIAENAGVSKATIYRWWPNKGAVALDAIFLSVEPVDSVPDTGSARTDLRRHLRRLARLYASPAPARTIAGVHFQSHHDEELAAEVWRRVIGPRRESAGAALRRGIERGELRPDLDADLVLDAMYGALYYNLLVSRQRMPQRYVDGLLDQIWAGIAAR